MIVETKTYVGKDDNRLVAQFSDDGKVTLFTAAEGQNQAIHPVTVDAIILNEMIGTLIGHHAAKLRAGK